MKRMNKEWAPIVGVVIVTVALVSAYFLLLS